MPTNHMSTCGSAATHFPAGADAALRARESRDDAMRRTSDSMFNDPDKFVEFLEETLDNGMPLSDATICLPRPLFYEPHVFTRLREALRFQFSDWCDDQAEVAS